MNIQMNETYKQCTTIHGHTTLFSIIEKINKEQWSTILKKLTFNFSRLSINLLWLTNWQNISKNTNNRYILKIFLFKKEWILIFAGIFLKSTLMVYLYLLTFIITILFFFINLICIINFLFGHFCRAPVESMETGSTNPTAMIVSGVGGSKGFEDPSEPIYTDPSLFERSRSLRSIAFSTAGQNIFKNEAFCHWWCTMCWLVGHEIIIRWRVRRKFHCLR